MKINVYHNVATATQHIEIAIPSSFVAECCEQDISSKVDRREAERILRNAALQAFGLKLTKPVTHSNDASVTPQILDGHCQTCWRSLAGVKLNPKNPDECEECGAL